MADPFPTPDSRKPLIPLAAGLALISAGSASAQIVYSGVQDITFTSTSSIPVDLNNDGTSDITLNFSVQNSTSKPSVGTLSTTDLAISVYPEGYGTGLNDYTAGESIKSTGTFSATPDAGYQFTQGYAGFTINPNATAQPLYGWAQFEYNSTSGVATLVDWAYNTTPGADIAAGEMSAVPEPADTAVIMGAAALLAGSVAIWRKREGASVAA